MKLLRRWLGKGAARTRASGSARVPWRPSMAPAAQVRGVRSLRYTTSPLLAAKTPPWRSKLLVLGVGVAFCTLLLRAAHIQLVDHAFYQAQGEVRYARTLELPANRGRILDRNGLILASSVPAPSLWAIPKDIDRADPKLAQLAQALGWRPSELMRRLDESPNFLWLRRQAEDDWAARVLALGIRGVHQVKEYKRQYPEGEAVAHVVGFTNVEDQGQEGVELAFQDMLAGRDGSRRVIKDRLGRVVEDIGDKVPAVDGQDVRLSIDSRVQFVAYQRLREAIAQHKARSGSVVVLDVRSGEVLALANYPSYNPAQRRGLSGAQLRNIALTDTFEPGSTVKPFTAALALQTRRVSPSTVIDTGHGRLQMGGWTISDTRGYGPLTVAEVIQKSSNVGTVRLAMEMQPREMHEMFSAIGFGERPPLPFPGAVSGRLRPYKMWRPVEQATMSYGYGLSTSLFQLARAYTVFARDGELIPLSLLHAPEPVEGVRVLAPEVARSVRTMLQAAAGPGGTAPRAQTAGYSVGGKTGTARKLEGGSYSDKKYRAWFVGLAPVERPRIVVAVMVDEPTGGKVYGGEVAAPVFSDVVLQSLRLLGVTPDLPVSPQFVASQRAVGVPESF